MSMIKTGKSGNFFLLLSLSFNILRRILPEPKEKIMISISKSIRDLAETLRIAEQITEVKFKAIIRDLLEILKNKDNFAPTEANPLQFSPNGKNKVKTMETLNFSEDSLPLLMKRLNRNLEMAASLHADLKLLHSNLAAPGKKTEWSNFVETANPVKGLSFEAAVKKAREVLEFAQKTEPVKELPETADEMEKRLKREQEDIQKKIQDRAQQMKEQEKGLRRSDPIKELEQAHKRIKELEDEVARLKKREPVLQP